MAHLLEVAFDGSIRGGAVLHSIAKGEAWKGFVVACFDCGKPGGRDWVIGGSVVETTRELMLGRSYALAAWGDEVGGDEAWV